jgi:hypothetical protein
MGVIYDKEQVNHWTVDAATGVVVVTLLLVLVLHKDSRSISKGMTNWRENIMNERFKLGTIGKLTVQVIIHRRRHWGTVFDEFSQVSKFMFSLFVPRSSSDGSLTQQPASDGTAVTESAGT